MSLAECTLAIQSDWYNLKHMGVIVRDFRESDTEALSRVWSIAFRGGKPRREDEPIVKDNSVFVAEADGEIVGGFTIEHMDATRGEATLKTGGVAAVAVLPELRFSGIGAEMMKFALERMKKEGYLLSSLYPFKEGYYRRFGYEVAGQRFKISLPADKLPNVTGSLVARNANADDWREFSEVYLKFARKYSGMWTRTETYWRNFLRDDSPIPVRYLLGDPPEAYLVVRQLGEFWGETTASQLVWTTPEGYRAALAVLRNIGVNRGRISWFEPSDSPYLAQYHDYGAEISLFRPIMFRCIDLPGALRQLPCAEETEFSLSVDDKQIPSNCGPWQVCAGPDGVRLEPSASAELTVDVRHFSQALLGQPSLDRLWAHGLVGGSARSVEAALRLLPPMPVCCYDFF